MAGGGGGDGGVLCSYSTPFRLDKCCVLFEPAGPLVPFRVSVFCLSRRLSARPLPSRCDKGHNDSLSRSSSIHGTPSNKHKSSASPVQATPAGRHLTAGGHVTTRREVCSCSAFRLIVVAGPVTLGHA